MATEGPTESVKLEEVERAKAVDDAAVWVPKETLNLPLAAPAGTTNDRAAAEKVEAETEMVFPFSAETTICGVVLGTSVKLPKVTLTKVPMGPDLGEKSVIVGGPEGEAHRQQEDGGFYARKNAFEGGRGLQIDGSGLCRIEGDNEGVDAVASDSVTGLAIVVHDTKDADSGPAAVWFRRLTPPARTVPPEIGTVRVTDVETPGLMLAGLAVRVPTVGLARAAVANNAARRKQIVGFMR